MKLRQSLLGIHTILKDEYIRYLHDTVDLHCGKMHSDEKVPNMYKHYKDYEPIPRSIYTVRRMNSSLNVINAMTSIRSKTQYRDLIVNHEFKYNSKPRWEDKVREMVSDKRLTKRERLAKKISEFFS